MAKIPSILPIAAGVPLSRQTAISLSGQVLIPSGFDMVGMRIWLDAVSGDPFVWPLNMPWWDFGARFSRLYLEGTPAAGGLLYVADCGTRPGVVPPLDPQPVTLNPIAGTAVQSDPNAKPLMIVGGPADLTHFRRFMALDPTAAQIGGAPPIALCTAANTFTASGALISLGQAALQATQPEGVNGALPIGRISSVQSGNAINVAAANTGTIYSANGAGSPLDFDWGSVLLAIYLSAAQFTLGWQLHNANFHGLINPSVNLRTNQTWCSGAAGAALAAGLYVFSYDKRGISLLWPSAPPAVLLCPPCHEHIDLTITNLDGALAHSFDFQLVVGS